MDLKKFFLTDTWRVQHIDNSYYDMAGMTFLSLKAKFLEAFTQGF